ncbi:MAG: hypothetical protein M1821_003591 [Bathelium mastoideum]|nr:MAG: hypothetical protein M1821_003591 [Bathelium mastoideum]
MTRWSSHAAVAVSLITGATSQVLDLSTADWTVSNPDLNVSVPGSLPSQAHLDLYNARVIGDPYYGLNNFNLRWVAFNNWTYTSGPLTGLSSNASSTWLVFNGLDTFTSIEMCGQHVGTTNNQFRQWLFDVSSLLSTCSNDPYLSINFGSAPNIAAAIAAQPGQETWPFNVEINYEIQNRQFIRKEQSDFGWDWGPAFAPAGPWQPAYVVQLPSPGVYVHNSMFDIYREGQLPLLLPDQTAPWVVNASLDYVGSAPSSVGLTYTLKDSSNQTVSSGTLNDVNITDSTMTGMVTLPDGSVDLWWPNGLGNQTLYYLTVSAVGSGNSTLASVTKRTAFRTIVLNEFPITDLQLSQGVAPGNNWHFEINGHEFYAKGSNFIPPDAFWPRVTQDRIESLFQSVIDANQNMLRVWASGAYSPDFLYDLGDQMGILLWSEFEFGDALYPVDADFLENCREEAYYQVRRNNHHPSLALWAGGNELENLELQTVNNSAPDEFDRYQAEYETLFLYTLGETVFNNTHSISYTPSSTSNGWLSLDFNNVQPITERYYNTTPGSVYGETDFYNYDSSLAFNTSALPVGRFSNEFGFHSMPSLQSWAEEVSPEDWYFNSSVVLLRNQHYPPGDLNTTNFRNTSLGMGEMTVAVQNWYPVPEKTDTVANFSAWCHATQIFQADFYTFEIEFYRRGSGMPNRQLGSLYWQLEDIWQAPTWAGIEYDGRWKVLHYRAKDIYQNVIISPFLNRTTGDLEVYVTSDLWTAATGTANFSFYSWDGTPLNLSTPAEAAVNVGAINSTRVFSTNINDSLKGYDISNVVLNVQTEVQGSPINQNTTQTFSHSSWLAMSRLGAAKFVDPGLTLSYSNVTSKFTVTATSGVAAWVWLDYGSGAVIAFDDNGFWLAKGESREIGYTTKSDSTNGSWVNGVTVQSMYNQTQPELTLPPIVAAYPNP